MLIGLVLNKFILNLFDHGIFRSDFELKLCYLFHKFRLQNACFLDIFPHSLIVFIAVIHDFLEPLLVFLNAFPRKFDLLLLHSDILQQSLVFVSFIINGNLGHQYFPGKRNEVFAGLLSFFRLVQVFDCFGFV